MRGASRHADRGRPPATGGGGPDSALSLSRSIRRAHPCHPCHEPHTCRGRTPAHTQGARRIPARNPNPSAYPAALAPTPYPFSSPRPQPRLQAAARASLVPHAFKRAWVSQPYSVSRVGLGLGLGLGLELGLGLGSGLESRVRARVRGGAAYCHPFPDRSVRTLHTGGARAAPSGVVPLQARRGQSAYPAQARRLSVHLPVGGGGSSSLWRGPPAPSGETRAPTPQQATPAAPACLPCPPTPALGAPPTPTSYLAGPHARRTPAARPPRPLRWSPCRQGEARAPTPQAPPPRLNPNP
eukprot:scaffold36837_cov68-Phaeocystis_antarctica.AAC.1